jgi:NAD(P)-dependent dehydrogenase (short-subunit alcohol dehydrogenase family)
MFNFSNKTALVTGASRGIGRATVLALAEAKARIIEEGTGSEALILSWVVEQDQTISKPCAFQLGYGSPALKINVSDPKSATRLTPIRRQCAVLKI